MKERENMKIYLMENRIWKIFENPDDAELKKRNIIIGDFAEIGNSAKIGDSAEIGNSAKIGDFAEIGKLDIFTKEYIYLQVGLLPDEKGKYILYKSVKEDLTDFYSSKYQYKVGKGDECNLKQNQAIECGEGWHWSNLWNAISFAEKKPHKIISAQINIKDILSVYTKVRVRKFSNVQIVDLDWKYKDTGGRKEKPRKPDGS